MLRRDFLHLSMLSQPDTYRQPVHCDNGRWHAHR
jgi:hypothetical protein